MLHRKMLSKKMMALSIYDCGISEPRENRGLESAAETDYHLLLKNL